MFEGVKGGGSIASSACCPAGTYWIKGSNVCTDCDAGKYNDKEGSTAEDACTDCDQGKYNDQPGSTNCTNCSAGKSTANPGSTTCLPCPAGRKLTTITPLNCSVCSIARFQPEIHVNDSVACQACPAGRYNLEPGDDDQDHVDGRRR